ncbi:MAG: hypothetical protein P4N24_20445, partial [Acidobacteriota bacterium]|nr:hypothetical protein [Acidobacteriota bacterium]
MPALILALPERHTNANGDEPVYIGKKVSDVVVVAALETQGSVLCYPEVNTAPEVAPVCLTVPEVEAVPSGH